MTYQVHMIDEILVESTDTARRNWELANGGQTDREHTVRSILSKVRHRHH